MSMAKAAGGSLYTDDFTAIKVVGNEPVVNAIKFYFDLAKDGVMSSPLNPSPAGWFVRLHRGPPRHCEHRLLVPRLRHF